MAKNKSVSHVIATILAMLMVISCLCVPAFAAEHPNTTDMQTSKVVTQVGAKSFYKVDNGVVVYLDHDAEGYEAVPSAYISGSTYNDGTEYGAYVVGNDEVVFVPLDECVLEGDIYYFTHGTKDGATVSGEVDTSTNEDPTMGTDFYLNVDNGIDPDGPSKEEVLPGNASLDKRVDYDITIKTQSSYQLEVTVPAYVCMYGYRGTGTVVTPTSDAYQLKNYSTVNADSEATIVDIVRNTHFAQILDEDHSDEELAAIAYNTMTEEYMWWYTMPSAEEIEGFEADNWIVNTNIADDHLNASGECYVIYINDAWRFMASGVLTDGVLREEIDAIDGTGDTPILSSNLEYGQWDFGTQPAVGDHQAGGQNEGLAVKVTEIQAIPATWRLVPMSTGINDIARGEIAMSIAPKTAISDASAIDLAKCSAPVDITERGWYMAAPELGAGDEATPTTLPLITNARIAGGNVNSAGCTSVVKVIYTVTPLFGIQNGQTSTVGGVDSNRI